MVHNTDMPNIKLAFDKSARHVDADGRLHVARSHISKAVVNPYYGREIPGYMDLGLQPDTVYKLLRDPVELERAAPTFARLPILSAHVPVTVDSPQPDIVVGAIGSDVVFNAPYLDADICVWDAEAIAGIETDKVRELSCAYRYVPVMEPGEYEGEAYDGRMTEIRGNHLALVEVGRAGPDVIVADSNPFKKEPAMRMTKLGKALFAALSAASPVLAADSALPALVGSANRKTFKKDDIKAKLMALDGDMDPQQIDNVIDALLDVEQSPTPQELPQAAADESPADKLRALLAGKVDDETLNAALALVPAPAAVDEKPSGAAVEATKQPEAAMDAALEAYGKKLRAELREAVEAAREVRDVVGDVIGMDSAAEVYGFALDHMKIDRKDVEGVAALRALFRVASAKAPAAAVAQDSAATSVVAQFPGLSRFRSA